MSRYKFDKYMKDILKKEREVQPNDAADWHWHQHNPNRIRDARNLERTHNRIVWRKKHDS